MNEEKIITAEHLYFTYQDGMDDGEIVNNEIPPAISDISFSVMAGEYIAVLGHNGSGKSTLAKLLNMILFPTGGKLILFGREVTAKAFKEEDTYNLRRDIGMVFQNPDNQLVATVVEEDVAFGPENLGLPRDEILERVREALELVGMTEYANFAPHKLSGGQKQRVAIAGVLAMRPKLIIFDESTSMLDPLGKDAVVALMENLNKRGITIIHITHDMNEAIRANRVIVMNDGEILFDDTPMRVFSHVKELKSVGLEVPTGRDILYSLATHGEKIQTDALDTEACATAIADILRKPYEQN